MYNPDIYLGFTLTICTERYLSYLAAPSSIIGRQHIMGDISGSILLWANLFYYGRISSIMGESLLLWAAFSSSQGGATWATSVVVVMYYLFGSVHVLDPGF